MYPGENYSVILEFSDPTYQNISKLKIPKRLPYQVSAINIPALYNYFKIYFVGHIFFKLVYNVFLSVLLQKRFLPTS